MSIFKLLTEWYGRMKSPGGGPREALVATMQSEYQMNSDVTSVEIGIRYLDSSHEPEPCARLTVGKDGTIISIEPDPNAKVGDWMKLSRVYEAAK